MALLLDDQFIYINYRGTIYDKDTYLNAVRCHELTYEASTSPGRMSERTITS